MIGRSKWQVKIEREAEDVFKGSKLTPDDRLIIRKWAQTIIDQGPESLQAAPSIWADHALSGEWRGCRASSFSNRGRIIYRVERQIVTVVVIRITTTHDYKRD